MKAQAMATATSMASRISKTITPHEGPGGVACRLDEFSGDWVPVSGGESLRGAIHSSVRRPTPNDLVA
jgi:hypothetical protein